MLLCECAYMFSSVQHLGTAPVRLPSPLQKAVFTLRALWEPCVLQASQDRWETCCWAGKSSRSQVLTTLMSSDVHNALWIRGIHANGYLKLNYQTLFMRSKLRHQLKRSDFKYTTDNLKLCLWPIFYNPGLFFKSPQNYFNLSGAVAPLIVYKVENQYCIWQMRALWSECQDWWCLVLHSRIWSEGSACLRGPSLLPDLLLHFKQTLWDHCFHFSPWLNSRCLSPFLSSCLYLCTDVPVPLLQVHQHRPESPQNARDDATLCPARVTMPVMPGHAQQ